MSIVRLEQAVADAIAAGEVVERPASVIKELVENSIDAGASRVTIEVDGAGMERILVVDDGAGIEASELPLAFTRHATSKLSSISDLGRVASLGFRGEALASIAAVARVECRAATAGAREGAVILAEYGEVGGPRAAPPVAGTRVEVSGLFDNTPARRAFVKRPATEMAAVVRVVAALALCHPAVALRLELDGRRSLETRGDGDLAAVLHAVVRGEVDLLSISGGRGAATVGGLICEPAHLRRSREHLYISVNGRPVASRSLAFAVEQAYRGLAQPGSFPVGAIAIALPAEAIDVNVHPTKREVRFRDDRAIFGLLQAAALDALSQSAAYAGSGLLAGAARLAEGPATYATAGGSPSAAAGIAIAEIDPGGVPQQPQLQGTEEWRSTGAGDAPLVRGPFRLLGQVLDSYVVAEGPSGIVLVDQHAAHERVVYNQLCAARDGSASTRQPMLVPPLLHLTPIQAACLEDCRGELAMAGLEIEDFGGGSARLVAHDPGLPSRGLDRIALDVLDSLLADGREVDQARRLERTTYTVACHAAIKFGQRLSREEMEALLRQLETADPGITCPHGRPTLLEISDSQLRREFRRT